MAAPLPFPAAFGGEDLDPVILPVLGHVECPLAVDHHVAGIPESPRRVALDPVADLAEEVRSGKFRQDLFYRLNVVRIELPALRERVEDVPILAGAFLGEIAARLGRPVPALTERALEELKSYAWPGNVRELRNVIAGAAAVCKTAEISPKDFVLFHKRRREPTLERVPLAGRTLESIEKSAIKQTLDHFAGNKTRAADVLGISLKTLHNKLKAYGS